MPIFQVAEYQVKPSAVDKVKRAVQEFVHYVEANESGTLLYSAWQQQKEPTRFTHFFIFEDEAARNIHSRSDAVKRFESVYWPELVGRVTFTDYDPVATNQWLQTATR
jgi:quinol monooxygenase YgiN